MLRVGYSRGSSLVVGGAGIVVLLLVGAEEGVDGEGAAVAGPEETV